MNNETLDVFLEKQLERTNYWLSFAEAKNIGALALDVALFSAVYDKSDRCQKMVTLLALVLFLLSIICSFASMIPKLYRFNKRKKIQFANEELNLVFYADTARFNNAREYIECVKKKYSHLEGVGVDAKELHLSQEIIVNSEIACYKYLCFKWSVIINIVAVLTLILSVFITG